MQVQVKDNFHFESRRDLQRHYENVRARLRNAQPIYRPPDKVVLVTRRLRADRWRPVLGQPALELEDPLSPPQIVEVPILDEDYVADPEAMRERVRAIVPPDQRGLIRSTITIASHMSGIPVATLVLDIRTALLVYWRQIGQYAARTVLGCSFPAIGRAYGGKDHTTVLHAYRAVLRRFEENEQQAKKDATEVCQILRLSLSPVQLEVCAKRTEHCDFISTARRRRLAVSQSPDGPNTTSHSGASESGIV